MRPAPIALQLYTIRDVLAKDFTAGVKQIAGMGYAGVETAGFPGTTPAQAARLFQELGLEVVAAHLPLPLGERQNEVLDAMAGLGCTRLVCPGLGHDLWSSLEGVQRAADLLNQGYQVAAQHGLSLGFHNHAIEFTRIDGQFAYDLLVERLDPGVFFEVDTYWVKVGGGDPLGVIRRLGRRAPLLHLKDGPGAHHLPQTAVGGGIMDVPALVQAAGENAEWLIVELDDCATDMMAAVQQSYQYLTAGGLARGR